MTLRPPTSTRPTTLFPYPTLVRSEPAGGGDHQPDARLRRRPGVREPHEVHRRGVRRGDGSSVGGRARLDRQGRREALAACRRLRSEEHKSELQSLMRITYAVFYWEKKE